MSHILLIHRGCLCQAYMPPDKEGEESASATDENGRQEIAYTTSGERGRQEIAYTTGIALSSCDCRRAKHCSMYHAKRLSVLKCLAISTADWLCLTTGCGPCNMAHTRSASFRMTPPFSWCCQWPDNGCEPCVSSAACSAAHGASGVPGAGVGATTGGGTTTAFGTSGINGGVFGAGTP